MFDNILGNNQTKTHLNNFWNYLDDLAEKNPEEYKKFISQQIQKGASTIKEEKFTGDNLTNKMPEKIKVSSFLALRFKVLEVFQDEKISDDKVKIFEDNKKEINEVPKILFSFEFQSESYNKKIKEEPKVYLSIVHSKEFTGPTDEQGNPLKNPTDDSQWKYIPTLFRYDGKLKSMSGKRCDFYDVLVNSIIIDKMKSNEELKKSILAYFVRKFCIFLDGRKYKLYTDNVKIIKNKIYKSVKSIPEEFKIENKSEELTEKPNSNLSTNESILNTISSSNNTLPKTDKVISKNFLEENKIIIPNNSENYTNTSTFYNMPKDKTKINAKNSKTVNTQEKKILIQEINTNTTKTIKNIYIKKNILSSNQMEVIFDFSEFDFENISLYNFDLQISENAVLLKLENTIYKEREDYVPVEMAFDFKVNVDNCSAKLNKLEKKLKVILEKS
jgi:hypothetical protein